MLSDERPYTKAMHTWACRSSVKLPLPLLPGLGIEEDLLVSLPAVVDALGLGVIVLVGMCAANDGMCAAGPRAACWSAS